MLTLTAALDRRRTPHLSLADLADLPAHQAGLIRIKCCAFLAGGSRHEEREAGMLKLGGIVIAVVVLFVLVLGVAGLVLMGALGKALAARRRRPRREAGDGGWG